MIKIDKQIKEALIDCFNSVKGGQLRISEETGIQQASLSRWNSGKVECMTTDNWRKIEPYIREFLAEDYLPRDVHGREIKNLIQNNNNVSTINQAVSGYLKILEKDPLTQSLMDAFQNLDRKNKLKVLTYIEELE